LHAVANSLSKVPTDPKGPTCADCYFQRQGLCALALERPCPTFRSATRILEPPRQPRLVPRPMPAPAY
jgi:hypothetical protein